MLRDFPAVGRAAVATLALALAASGCGIKGPLKLPPPAAPSAPATGSESPAPPATDEGTPGKKP